MRDLDRNPTAEEISAAYWSNRRKMEATMAYWRWIGAQWEPARYRTAMQSVLSNPQTF
jgi:hypothetical protein